MSKTASDGLTYSTAQNQAGVIKRLRRVLVQNAAGYLMNWEELVSEDPETRAWAFENFRLQIQNLGEAIIRLEDELWRVDRDWQEKYFDRYY